MGVTKTQEPQNQVQYDTYVEKGPVQMGPWSTHIFRTDPKHLGFLLSRYKFCAKMLQGKSDVLEVGCGDAFGTPVVLQSVQKVHCIDFEPLVIEDTKTRFGSECIENITFSIHDITVAPMQRKFDAAYSLDVIEHIPYESEDLFMLNIGKSLRSDAVCIVGTPNINAQGHASVASAQGHINLKSAETLRQLLSEYFCNVFLFSMNDEVVHTGFYPMAQYLIGVGVGLKARDVNANLYNEPL